MTEDMQVCPVCGQAIGPEDVWKDEASGTEAMACPRCGFEAQYLDDQT